MGGRIRCPALWLLTKWYDAAGGPLEADQKVCSYEMEGSQSRSCRASPPCGVREADSPAFCPTGEDGAIPHRNSRDHM
jgi:hypothetical protein